MTGEFNVIGGIKYHASSIKQYSMNEDGLFNVELKNGSCFTYYEQNHLKPHEKADCDIPSILAEEGDNGCSFNNCRLESVKDNPEQRDAYLFDPRTKIKNLSIAGEDLKLNFNPKNIEKIDFHN